MSSFSPVRLFALVVAAGVLLSACGGDQGTATEDGRSEPDEMAEPAGDETFHETSSCDDKKGDVASSSKTGSAQRAEDLTSVQLEATREELTITFETSASLPDKPAPHGETWFVLVHEEGVREPLFSLTASTRTGAAGLEGQTFYDFARKEAFTSSRPLGDVESSDARIVMSTAIADLPEVPARIAWYAQTAVTTDDTYVDGCPALPPPSLVLSPRQLEMLPTLEMPTSS